MSKDVSFMSRVVVSQRQEEGESEGMRGKGLLGFITSQFVKLVTHSFHVVIVMNRLLSSSFFITGFP